MPVILPLVLQSVWPACLPFRPPQGLAGRPWAPGCWAPLSDPQSSRILLLCCSLWPLFLSCPSAVHSCQPHRASSTLMLIVALPTCLMLTLNELSCRVAIFLLSFIPYITSSLLFLDFPWPTCSIPDPLPLKVVSMFPRSFCCVWGDRWGSQTLTFQLHVHLQSCPFSLPAQLVLSVPGNESAFNDWALIWVEET